MRLRRRQVEERSAVEPPGTLVHRVTLDSEAETCTATRRTRSARCSTRQRFRSVSVVLVEEALAELHAIADDG